MTSFVAHVHGGGDAGGIPVEWMLAAPFLIAAAAYLAAASHSRRSGRSWSWMRTTAWLAGLAAAAAGFVGPLAAAAHDGFTAHMGAHLLVGMVAPLLLALAAPATLALRAMSVTPARRLSRLLRSRVARFFTNPVVAALLNVGGMWALYSTPLYDAMRASMLVHVMVMAHFLFAGFLYTVSLVAIDPSPHRASFGLRAGVLVVSLAAHGILAKLLYAHPLASTEISDARAGAQLMFYGGDAVDVVLMVLLCAEWYRSAGRRLPSSDASTRRETRPSSSRHPTHPLSPPRGRPS